MTLVRRHPDLLVLALGAFGALACLPLLGTPLYAVGLVVLIAATWAAARSPAIPLALGTIPPLVDAIAGSDPLPKGGFTFLFAAWLALALALSLIRRRAGPAVSALLCGPVLAACALLGLMLLRVGVSPDQAYGQTKLQLYVADVLVFMVGAVFAGARERDTRLVIQLTLIVASAGATLFLIHLLGGNTAPTVGGRYSLSADEYPIELGRDSADGLLVALWMVLCGRSRTARMRALIACPLLAIAMIAAGSRGPVLAFVLGLLALLALTAVDARARRRLVLVAIAFAAAAVVVPLVVPGSALGRSLSAIVGSAAGLSSNGRSTLWAVSLTQFSHHFWLGIGTGGFAGLGTGLMYPHNVFLEAATELGLTGLCALLVVIVGSGARLGQVWRRTAGQDKLLAALVLALFVMALTNACFSGAFQDNREIWMWGGLGIGMSVRLLGRAAQPLRRVRAT